MPKAQIKTTSVPSPHNYIYPGTQTLKNKYGEQNLQLFLEKCSHDIEREKEKLLAEPSPEYFDSSYLCHIHRQLFHNIFEWAGLLRTTPFTFADGSVAAMPEMKKEGWESAFVTDKEIISNLYKIDRDIAERNNLQGSTRQEFINTAANIFVALKHIHPFVDGNEHTEQVFLEKLALAAGHRLDFSLATKKRMATAFTQAIQYGNVQLVKNLFEDISHPEKIPLLQEFMNNMKDTGRDFDNYLVIAAKDGITYTGVCEHSGANSFTLNMQGTYIVCSKDQLRPEQVKKLKVCDQITLTTPKTEDLEKILIPREILAPLTEDEFAKIARENIRFQDARNKVRCLSRIVYGDSEILNKHIEDLIQNPYLSQQLADRIRQEPGSIANLAGRHFLCFKNQARIRAEEHVGILCTAITDYAQSIKYIIQDHQYKQEAYGKMIKKPSRNLQNLLCLSPEAQSKALLENRPLCDELYTFLYQVGQRLSINGNIAIEQNNRAAVAKSIGVSEQKAQGIIDLVQKTREVRQQDRVRVQNRLNALTMAN